MKKFSAFLVVLMIASLVLASCAPAATPTTAPPTQAVTEPTQAPEPTTVPPTAAPAALKVCQVTDTGGIDDKSFNATAWKGVTDAEAQLGVQGSYLESQQQTDYEKNINAFLSEGCDLIITVGFLLGDATQAAAEANPNQLFSIVDYAYDPAIPNVLGQVFATDQAAFLAGYAAAAVTKTGKVGTFGGMQIPTVTVFMDGFAMGVKYYNDQKGTSVEVLGWDPATQTGLFTGNFESTDDGRTMGQSLMDEGADIIMPVAGPVGLGTAAAALERGNTYIIGVDNDWYLTSPEYDSIVLTSVMKNMDITTLNAIEAVQDGIFQGGVTIGTLDNGGVGLADFHDLASAVPDAVKTELDTVKTGIISGTINVKPAEPAAVKVCQVTDTGGIDDKSFNATAWKGVTDAMALLKNVDGKYLESQQQTDYEKNINAFLSEGCDLIITVGFLLGDATQAAAQANPTQKFSIVDYAYDPMIPNVLGQVFNTDEAAFLAGYLAAGVSKTGKVGTFGGMQIPTVTVFMDGFTLGVDYYNAKHGTSVEVLGWDPISQTGLFTGNFESTDDGRTMGQSLMDEGADIIMPVAGPVGLGTAAAALERGNTLIVGVDSDWYLTSPEYASIVLTSVMKNMDITTFNAIKDVQAETFAGGVTVGTLKNGGVGLADFHDLNAQVPDQLKTELDQVKADIIAGNIATKP
jgi:basic membrane protein A